MSKKVLITHAVPVNNGDAALVMALYNSLQTNGYSVTIATYYYSVVKRKYPDLPLIRELGDYFILRKLPFLKPLFQKVNFMVNRKISKPRYIYRSSRRLCKFLLFPEPCASALKIGT